MDNILEKILKGAGQPYGQDPGQERGLMQTLNKRIGAIHPAVGLQNRRQGREGALHKGSLLMEMLRKLGVL